MLIALREVPDFWGLVRPDEVGRGLGSALLTLGENRARERGATKLHAGTFAESASAAEFFERRGYRDVRHYFTMHVRLTEPPVPAWPDGVRVERFHTEDARAFYDALNDAFADEWGWAPMEYDEWYRLRIEGDDLIRRCGSSSATAKRSRGRAQRPEPRRRRLGRRDRQGHSGAGVGSGSRCSSTRSRSSTSVVSPTFDSASTRRTRAMPPVSTSAPE